MDPSSLTTGDGLPFKVTVMQTILHVRYYGNPLKAVIPVDPLRRTILCYLVDSQELKLFNLGRDLYLKYAETLAMALIVITQDG